MQKLLLQPGMLPMKLNAQVAEFDLTARTGEWMNAAFAKFADKTFRIPLKEWSRPGEKTRRDDRLIGLLALKHNIYPEGLLAGIMACFEYRDGGKDFTVADLIIVSKKDGLCF